MDITTNGRPHAMIDLGVEANVITKEVATKLSFIPSNSHLKTVSAPLTPVCGVANGVSITLGKWQSKTNLTAASVDIFDIILG